MRLLLLIGMMLVSASAMAHNNDWRKLATQNIWISVPATPGDVERALMTDLTHVMRNYIPMGKGLKNYQVTGSGTSTRLSFEVDKDIGPFTKKIIFVASADRPGRSSSCGKSAVNSYYLEFNLKGSSGIVTENVQAFGIEMCVVPKGDGSFFIKSRLSFKEGDDLGGASGDAMQKMIRAQAFPLLLAISKTVETYDTGR